jgi:hypothetical protein
MTKQKQTLTTDCFSIRSYIEPTVQLRTHCERKDAKKPEPTVNVWSRAQSRKAIVLATVYKDTDGNVKTKN